MANRIGIRTRTNQDKLSEGCAIGTREAADEAKRLTDEVFSQHWTDGDGADAAYEHYSAEHKAHLAVVDVLDGVADTNGRLGEQDPALPSATSATRTIRLIEKSRTTSRRPAVFRQPRSAASSTQIPHPHRGLQRSAEEQVGDETTALTNEFGFPEAPPGSPAGGQDKPSDRDDRRLTW